MQIKPAALWEAVKVPSLPPGTAHVPLCSRKIARFSFLPAGFCFRHPSLPLLLLSRCLTEPLYYVSFPSRQSPDMLEESYNNANFQTLCQYFICIASFNLAHTLSSSYYYHPPHFTDEEIKTQGD